MLRDLRGDNDGRDNLSRTYSRHGLVTLLGPGRAGNIGQQVKVLVWKERY